MKHLKRVGLQRLAGTRLQKVLHTSSCNCTHHSKRSFSIHSHIFQGIPHQILPTLGFLQSLWSPAAWYFFSNPSRFSITQTKEQVSSKELSHLLITRARADWFSLRLCCVWSSARHPQRMKADPPSGEVFRWSHLCFLNGSA